MGGALAEAVSRRGGYQLLLCDRIKEKAEELCRRVGGEVIDEGELSRLTKCDVLFIGVKPVGAKEALNALSRASDCLPLIISMVAGMRIDAISGELGGHSRIIRIMPNTPVAVGEGAVLYSLGSGVKDGDESEFLSVLAAAGRLTELCEELMDKATAISGCGPAFVFAFIEAMIAGGKAIGLPPELCRELAAQTVLGSARLVMESEKSPRELKIAVSSPGGSTIEGVKRLEEAALADTVAAAVKAAYEKTAKLI